MFRDHNEYTDVTLGTKRHFHQLSMYLYSCRFCRLIRSFLSPLIHDKTPRLQEILVGRAMSAAASHLRSNSSVDDKHGTITLVKEDFVQAMNGFVPVTMRGLTKSDYEGGRRGWSDVGGLREIRKAIEEVHRTQLACTLFVKIFEDVCILGI